MAEEDDPVPIYLDQNVFSRMQEGGVDQGSVLELLDELSSRSAILVYSLVHVDECRQSDQPEVFVDIMERVSAHYLEPSAATDTTITLSPKKAKALILAETDITDEALRRMEDLLKPLHFAAGWLDKIEAKALQKEFLERVHSFWGSLAADLPSEMLDLFEQGKVQMLKSIMDIPLERMKDESLEAEKRLRKHLPKNYSQLDAVPDDEVVEYLLSCLNTNEQAAIRSSYPPQFWAAVKTREEGKLTGLAFMLFMLGLVRDPRVKKRERQRREKHFLGQFQDCRHIETASRCAMFVTFDKGAARLAKAVYAYAGVKTEVMHLKTSKT